MPISYLWYSVASTGLGAYIKLKLEKGSLRDRDHSMSLAQIPQRAWRPKLYRSIARGPVLLLSLSLEVQFWSERKFTARLTTGDPNSPNGPNSGVNVLQGVSDVMNCLTDNSSDVDVEIEFSDGGDNDDSSSGSSTTNLSIFEEFNEKVSVSGRCQPIRHPHWSKTSSL